ncbi:MAG: sulfatase [Planctomycetota bacterium]
MPRKDCSRREVLMAAGAGALGLAIAPLAWSDEKNQKRPNIIFIMTDDHAAHALSCYGSRINQTPNLDRLAQQGMRFSNCFCTNGICAPSRATILTGKYSHLNGVIDNREKFDGTQLTFPKLLQKAGYNTAMIGKWHLKSEPTGFDYWNVLPGQGVYHNPDLIEMGQRRTHAGYVTDIITDLSIKWLKERPADTPFMLMCHHKAPHRRWDPNEKYKREFAGKVFQEPDTFNDDYRTRCDAARQQSMSVAKHLTKRDTKGPPPEGLSPAEVKKWKYQRYMQDYLACVASVDENVGRLLDYLDQSGLAQNTIVVYTSDQGFFLGDHGWYDKRFMYEEALRMPLLVRYPRIIKAGSTTDALVLNLDFASTFLDYANVKSPDEMQGASFRSILQGQVPEDWRTSIYYHYYEFGQGAPHDVRPHVGVRTLRYKLIHFMGDMDCWELYDLESDPHELKNVFADDAYAGVVTELQIELRRLQKHYGDVPVAATRPAIKVQP